MIAGAVDLGRGASTSDDAGDPKADTRTDYRPRGRILVAVGADSQRSA